MSSSLPGSSSSSKSCLAVAVAAVIAAGCSADPQVAKEKYLASGDRYVAAGRLPEAVIEYRNAVQRDPKAGDARVKLAAAHLSAGQGGHALEEYVRAADLLPDDPAVHVKASGLLLLAGRFDDAKLWAGKALAQDPGYLEAKILLANSLAGLRDFDAAVAQIEEAIRLNPDRGETYSNLGAIELRRGQRDAAEQAFKKAVNLDARSAPARLALANFYWADSRWSAAEAELRKVVELDPANAHAHRALASFYVATSRAPEAEPHLKTVRDLTKDPAAALALADYYTARKDDASARAVLESMTGATGTDAAAEVRLATLDHRSGNRAGAYQWIGKVLEKDQANLSALLTKSSMLAADGRLEDALASASLAVEKHPETPAALFALGRIQAARRQTDAAVAAFDRALRLNPRATDAKAALARLHLAAGRSDASLALAREVVAAEPQNVEARLTVVRGLLAKKDLQKAQAELHALLQRYPDAASVYLLSGVLSGMKRDDAGARRDFERALQLQPASTEAVAGLVALDLSAKRVAEARARVDERLAVSETDPAVLMLAARTYAASGDAKQAEALLRRLIQTSPTHLEAYGALAQLYLGQKRLDAALAEFEELAKRDPRPVGALTFAGIILQGQGKDAEARDRFIRALELDPNAAVAANNLAWLYAQTDENLDRALDLALRAKAGLADRPEVNDTIGWVYYRKGQASDAIPYFVKSAENDESNPTYHYHLGLAYVKGGDPTRGRQSLERALKLKPDFDGAADARGTLMALSR